MRERSDPARVGVRELRQNLSVYLDRVKAGESLEVTEHGYPVARLGPLDRAGSSVVERLVVDGRAHRGRGNLADLGRPRAVAGRSLSEILRAQRDEDER